MLHVAMMHGFKQEVRQCLTMTVTPDKKYLLTKLCRIQQMQNTTIQHISTDATTITQTRVSQLYATVKEERRYLRSICFTSILQAYRTIENHQYNYTTPTEKHRRSSSDEIF